MRHLYIKCRTRTIIYWYNPRIKKFLLGRIIHGTTQSYILMTTHSSNVSSNDNDQTLELVQERDDYNIIDCNILCINFIVLLSTFLK